MKTRILLVEDDERLAKLTAEYLRKNDFELTSSRVATLPKRASLPSDPTWSFSTSCCPARTASRSAAPCARSTAG
jgi:CheY-like chemotaxis protein